MIEALSFTLLTFAVAVIGLAQFHLYRLFQARELITAGWSSPQWPLTKISAGESLPDAITESVGDAWVGLLLISADNHDEYGVVVSVMSVAAEWDVDFLLARRESGSATGWEARLPPSVGERSFVMDAATFDALGCRGTPALLAVDRGRVLDASHDLASPSSIADRMRYVAPRLKQPALLIPKEFDNELGSTP